MILSMESTDRGHRVSQSHPALEQPYTHHHPSNLQSPPATMHSRNQVPAPVHFVSPALGTGMVTGTSNYDLTVKRCRDGLMNTSSIALTHQGGSLLIAAPIHSMSADSATVGVESSSKKSRANNYISPRNVPKSFTSTMGSLAAPPQALASHPAHSNQVSSTAAAAATSNHNNFSNSNANLRIHFRRQLSGGNLDPFLGDHDSMDVDAADSRPRSMSF